ncbi:glycosyltransferase family 4 protein [Rhodococcus opacus]|uniref:Glycosyltransferase family 4 protein n=2 Tax=Rhodococcus opacus TaxID=37919 RepID=A0AAX3YN03_RHOOP|nr:glycosyltransferase family 4 protein [Rhodococcus opacus]MCZ4587520.1 glycosyltransferase family 4 protein [Rhodococcus opacus]WLF50907.1 glycosyltransferase family 4 protein [Rhodococcus opacus]
MEASGNFRFVRYFIAAFILFLLRIRGVFRLSVGYCESGKGILRWIFTVWHAIRLSAHVLASRKSPHLHAHFLGRTFEVVCFVKCILGSGIIVTATGHAGDVSNPESLRRLRALCKYSDGVVCASTFVGTSLEEAVGVRPLGTVHCGVSIPDVPDRIGCSSAARPLRILSVGRMIEKKGFDDCVAALSLLAQDAINIEWTFVGDGPVLKSLICSASQLPSHVEASFPGYLPNSAILDLMEQWADVFVLTPKPSANGDIDGIPVVLMEALSFGLPVVSSSIAGIPELVRHGATGLLVPPGEPTAVAVAIKRLAEDGVLAASLGRAGRELVSDEFSSLGEAEKMVRVFEFEVA